MSAITQEPVVFRVDQEHGGLRFAVLVTFLLVWFAAFFLVSSLLAADGPALLAVLVGFAAAFLVTMAVERYLKRVWLSGRSVTISAQGVELSNRGAKQVAILSEDPATAIMWRFVVAKRARIPKGWSMLACALQYEGTDLITYTFLAPAAADAFARLEKFTKLEPKKRRTLNDDEREDLQLAGAQRRLKDVENARWIAGAEMTPEDFASYIDTLYARFPEWMPPVN